MVNYENQTVTQLKDMARSKGVKGYSGLKKVDLISLLKRHKSKKSSKKSNTPKHKSRPKKFNLKLVIKGSKKFLDYYLPSEGQYDRLDNYFEDVRVVGNPSSGKVIVYIGKQIDGGKYDDEELIYRLGPQEEFPGGSLDVIEPKTIRENIKTNKERTKKITLLKEESHIKKLKE